MKMWNKDNSTQNCAINWKHSNNRFFCLKLISHHTTFTNSNQKQVFMMKSEILNLYHEFHHFTLNLNFTIIFKFTLFHNAWRSAKHNLRSIINQNKLSYSGKSIWCVSLSDTVIWLKYWLWFQTESKAKAE